ncbi:patatin-like phospholipase family protein [Marinilongibacter aquaticus]|uniref:patatin-like phospholipase family protein n=1 Tax=Marinilongibacter aquaticus TaxID=2975157 RepID=UPI0021BD1C45|nr:patatin-like phospholipase family protein [Marinilongibacter aquaticus]UBM59654.1 patatin-like phospholipase family protein [Marinilongibacter aquaticus]
MNLEEKKIGLCLSGGGARGFAHLGVLQALDELNIPIAKISGASAGAFAAAFYAGGYAPKEALDIILQRGFWQYVGIAPNRWGLLSLEKTRRVLEELFPENAFEKLNIPIAICATNIGKGKPEYFEKGQLVKPILASAAIPALFKPVKIEGNYYLDGGLTNNMPLKPLKKCDFTIAVNITPFHKRMPVHSVKDIVLKTIYISVDQQTRQKAKKADLNLIPDGIMRYDGFRMKNAHKLFDLGYESAIKSFANIQDQFTYH